jgi:hypothetical protein
MINTAFNFPNLKADLTGTQIGPLPGLEQTDAKTLLVALSLIYLLRI